MAATTVNLLSVAGNPAGAVRVDLEYDDATLETTALIGSNTTAAPFTCVISRNSDGAVKTVTIPANTPNRRLSWAPNWAKVVVTPDDVIPPISVSGA